MEEYKDELLSKAIYYRGIVINHCITLEKAIEEYICKTITENEESKYKIYVYLLDRMNFDSKISTFQSMLQATTKDKADFKKKHEKLIGKLRKVKDERNKFAHYLTNTNSEAIERGNKELSLISFRDKVTKNKNVYNNTSINQLIEDILKCAEVIYNLIDNPPSGPASE